MSKVANDYIIVTADGAVALEMKVFEFLTEGWQPIGGVSFDSNKYLQAMVKYKES